MAAERIHRALELPGGIEGALRVLELHPLFNPTAYVSAEFGPDIVHVPPVARARGRRVGLAGQARRDTCRCRRSSPRSIRTCDVEVAGTETDWTARVFETDTAAKEFPEVSVVQGQRRVDVRVRAEEVAAADGGVTVEADPAAQVVAQFARRAAAGGPGR